MDRIDLNDAGLAVAAVGPAITLINTFCSHFRTNGRGLVCYDCNFDDAEKQRIYLIFCGLAIFWAARILYRQFRIRERQEQREAEEERRRLEQQRRRLRRRIIEPSSSSVKASSAVATSSNTEQPWQSGKSELEQEMGKLPDSCSTENMNKRPVLPFWLIDTCHRSIATDKQQFCNLLAKEGNDEEVLQYVQQHGGHLSDYGLDLRGTLAFLNQHGSAIRAKLQHGVATKAALPA